jgi:hypothetical protein
MKYLWLAAVTAVLSTCAGAQQAAPAGAVPAEVPAAPPGKVILSRSVEDAPTPAKPSMVQAGAPATDAERQAITFLAYDLDVHLRPREHAMAVRARIQLRNDSSNFIQLAMDQRPRRRYDGCLFPAVDQQRY